MTTITFSSIVPKTEDCNADQEELDAAWLILNDNGYENVYLVDANIVSGIGILTFQYMSDTPDYFKPHPKILDDILELFSDGTGNAWEVTTVYSDQEEKPAQAEFDDIQEVILDSYEDARITVESPADIQSCPDDLLRFLLVELSRKEDCSGPEEAIDRIDSVIRQLEEIKAKLGQKTK